MVPVRKKSIIIEEKEVYDIEGIFARVIGLLDWPDDSPTEAYAL